MADTAETLLMEMVGRARIEGGAIGKPLTIKQITGDTHGRLIDCFPTDEEPLPLRDLTGNEWGRIILNLASIEVHKTRERAGELVFSRDEIMKIREAKTSYESLRRKRKICNVGIPEARRRLGRHFGSEVDLEKDDSLIDLMLHHSDSPHAMRAQGKGVDAFPIIGAFRALSKSKEWMGLRHRNEIDYVLLGVSNFNLMQYDGVDELPVFSYLIARNPDDPSFIQYNYHWKRYLRPNTGHEFSFLDFAFNNPIGGARSYYGGEILGPTAYYCAGKSAVELGADLNGVDWQKLGGYSPVMLIDKAINYNKVKSLSKSFRFCYEDIITEIIAKIKMQLACRMYKDAYKTIEEGKKELVIAKNVTQNDLVSREQNLNLCEADYLIAISTGIYGDPLIKEALRIKRNAKDILNSIGQYENARAIDIY